MCTNDKHPPTLFPSFPPDDVFGSQLSLLSDSSIQEQFDQVEFEKEEIRAKYDELKVSTDPPQTVQLG